MASKLESVNDDVLRLIVQAVVALPNNRVKASLMHSQPYLQRPVEKLSRVSKRLRFICMPALLAKVRVKSYDRLPQIDTFYNVPQALASLRYDDSTPEGPTPGV